MGLYQNREQGAGNEHRERENKKMGIIPNLNPSPISNFISSSLLCFHFLSIFTFSGLVPRSLFPVLVTSCISRETEGTVSPFLIESNPLNDSS